MKNFNDTIFLQLSLSTPGWRHIAICVYALLYIACLSLQTQYIQNYTLACLCVCVSNFVAQIDGGT
jgi:hypothetical protein